MGSYRETLIDERIDKVKNLIYYIKCSKIEPIECLVPSCHDITWEYDQQDLKRHKDIVQELMNLQTRLQSLKEISLGISLFKPELSPVDNCEQMPLKALEILQAAFDNYEAEIKEIVSKYVFLEIHMQ